MTDWLDDEIKRATERANQRAKKFARRESDERAIATKGRGFWSALIKSLGESIDRFNNRPGAGESVEISAPPHDDNRIYIRTPGYPNAQLLLRFLDDGSGIAISMVEHQTTRSPGDKIWEGTIEFAVNDDGQIVAGYQNTVKNVPETTEYLLKQVFQYV